MDAVRPDPPVRHEIEVATKQFLADPKAKSGEAAEARALLLAYFQDEAASVPPVLAEMQRAPRLATMQERANQLTGLTATAQQAIEYLSKGDKASASWKQTSLQQIEDAKKRSAIVRFLFLDSLTELVNATRQ